MSKERYTDNIEALKQFKESINSRIDEEIAKNKRSEKVSSIDSFSIGKLKILFESISDKMFENDKTDFSNYINAIKENDSAKKMYFLYESALNPKFTTNPKYVVESMLVISDGINKDDVEACRCKIIDALRNFLESSNIEPEEIDKAICDKEKIVDALDYLFSNEKNVDNLFDYTNKADIVADYISDNMGDEKRCDSVAQSCDGDISSLEDLSNNELESWENNVVRDIALNDLSNNGYEKLFNQYKGECLDLIDDLIGDAENIEDSSRFSVMKENLMNKHYDSSKEIDDLLKLSELKYTLGK